MAITLGVDLGLFGAMLENDSSPKSVKELAARLNADAGLLGMLHDPGPLGEQY